MSPGRCGRRPSRARELLSRAPCVLFGYTCARPTKVNVEQVEDAAVATSTPPPPAAGTPPSAKHLSRCSSAKRGGMLRVGSTVASMHGRGLTRAGAETVARCGEARLRPRRAAPLCAFAGATCAAPCGAAAWTGCSAHARRIECALAAVIAPVWQTATHLCPFSRHKPLLSITRAKALAVAVEAC